MIAFLVLRLGVSLRDAGALTPAQAQVLIDEYAMLTGTQPSPSASPTIFAQDSPGGEILLDTLYDAVKARMEATPHERS